MIKQIRVVNYKCLGDVTVSLNPVTVLIGRSGTGKTTFVESLRFLRDYITYRDNAVQQYGGWERILSITFPKPRHLWFVVLFNAPGVREDYEYTLKIQERIVEVQTKWSTTGCHFEEERLTLGDRVLYHQVGDKWLQEPQTIEQPKPGNVALGSLGGVPEITRAQLVLTRGLGWYSFSDTVLSLVQEQVSQRATVQPSQPSPPQSIGLADNGVNFAQAYNVIASNLHAWVQQKEILAALRRLDESVTGVEARPTNLNEILVTHEVSGKAVPLNLTQESEGLRRFLATLVALYQVPPKQTLIFEEPEKGIHPGALAVLAEQFKACVAEDRGQILLTTHSPELLNHFAPEDLRVVEMENYVTRIGPVEAEQVQAVREQLLYPGELLTVTLARAALA